jgi:hypothetical protein
MANIMLGFPNRADAAVLSGGQWQVPITNLQDRRLSRVARSASLARSSTQFDVDLGVPRRLSLIAIVRHNLGLNAKYRVRIALDAAFANVVYDSAVLPRTPAVLMDFLAQQYFVEGRVWGDAWPRLYSTAMLDWEDPNWWDGRLPEEDRKGYPGLLVQVLAEPAFGRYVRIEFDDPDNPDGFIELGRMFLSQGWSPHNNASWNPSLGWEFDTTMDRALDGTPYFDRKTGRRVHKFGLDFLDPNEAYGKVFEMQRGTGTDREVMLVWDRDDPVNLIRHSFVGRMRQINPIQLSFLNNFTNAFEIEELT